MPSLRRRQLKQLRIPSRAVRLTFEVMWFGKIVEAKRIAGPTSVARLKGVRSSGAPKFAVLMMLRPILIGQTAPEMFPVNFPARSIFVSLVDRFTGALAPVFSFPELLMQL